MAAHGRAMVFPLAIGVGARPVDVPGRGTVLCVSAFFPFRLSDGEPMRPADWYQAVSVCGGENAVPDAMVPLPGAEVLVLGDVPPVEGDYREARVRCGTVAKDFLLRPNPDAPEVPLRLGPATAAWHRDDNPMGRGGPEDRRRPLILDRQETQRPLWLGATPLEHPTRMRRVGTSASGIGWPGDTQQSVLNEAHPAFWAQALYPGDPLAVRGLGGADVETNLPRYRTAMTSGRADGSVVLETSRIHAVTLIPSADQCAVFWRAAIDLGDDVLGENVVMLVVALEDMNAPVQDEYHWAGIATDRWDDPSLALDDRPLLPAALAAAMPAPFELPEGASPIEERIAAAEDWVKKETGAPETNPFSDSAPEEAGLVGEMQQAAAGDGANPPNSADIAALAQTAMAAAKKKHDKRGFPAPSEPESGEEQPPPDPVPRGEALGAEIARRLRAPFQSQHEVEIARQLRAAQHGPGGAA